MRCQNCLSMLHYSTSGMLCRSCGRLEPHNPITTAAIFITFIIIYPATAPNREPPSAENTRFSIDKLLGSRLTCPSLFVYSYVDLGMLSFCGSDYNLECLVSRSVISPFLFGPLKSVIVKNSSYSYSYNIPIGYHKVTK